jgi:hypothetical protein
MYKIAVICVCRPYRVAWLQIEEGRFRMSVTFVVNVRVWVLRGIGSVCCAAEQRALQRVQVAGL